MESSTDTQALARTTDNAVIRSPRDYSARLQVWQREHYHVLTPFANFSALPPHLGIVPTLVQLDDDPKGPAGDVYQDNVFTRGTDVAIAKIGLAKIAQAAGMSIATTRTDPRTLPHYWEVKAVVRFIGIDGTPQEVSAMEEYDLRDGSERAKQMQPKQLVQQRIKGLRNCEARAINAAIRQYGVKQKYTRDELGKPFVILRLVHMPDMADPTTRQLVTERALAGTTALYGGASHALPPAAAHEDLGHIGVADPVAAARVIDAPPAPPVRLVKSVTHEMESGHFDIVFADDVVAITRAQTTAQAMLEAKRAGQGVRAVIDDATGDLRSFEIVEATPQTPADPSLRKIAEVKVAGRSKPDAPSKWTRYEVIATTGESWSTFSDRLATLATEAKTKGWFVRLVDKENEKYPDQRDIESLTLIDPAQLTLPGTEPAGGY